MKKISVLSIIPALSITLLSTTSLAKTVTHQRTFTLTHMEAFQASGSVAPGLNDRCLATYHAYLFMPVTLNYQIDTQSLIERASVALFNEHNVPLTAEGITAEYAFITTAFGYSPLISKQVISIYATISNSFNHETLSILLKGGQDKNLGSYNCMLSGEHFN